MVVKIEAPMLECKKILHYYNYTALYCSVTFFYTATIYMIVGGNVKAIR